MIVVIATVRARAGCEQHLAEVLRRLVTETRQEQGCLQCDLHIRHEDPAAFALYERWSNETALNHHLRAKHVDAAFSFESALSEGPPNVDSYILLETVDPKAGIDTRPLAAFE